MFKLIMDLLEGSACLEIQWFLCHDLIVETDWLISIESMRQNVEEEEHAHQVRPDINCFIVKPK